MQREIFDNIIAFASYTGEAMRGYCVEHPELSAADVITMLGYLYAGIITQCKELDVGDRLTLARKCADGLRTLVADILACEAVNAE